jgi:hypothetical protein
MMSGSLAGGPFPGPFDPEEANQEMKRAANWHKVQSVAPDRALYENQLRLPEEILQDPRVAEPIRQIAEQTGSTIEEVEQAIMALLTPRAASKRRH